MALAPLVKYFSVLSNMKMMMLLMIMGMLMVVMFRNHLTSAFFLRSEENTSLIKGLAMEGTIDIADLHKQDFRMLNDLSHYLSYNRRNFKSCTNSAVDVKLPLHKLNTQYINSHIQFSLPHGGSGIVSVPRKRATCLLMKLALTLPEGDIVETGSFIGTSAVLILHTLKDFDQCRRKLWVFDSFEGLPLPSKEDKAQGSPGQFSVTLQNFTTNLLSQNVFDANTLVITKGWFKDTLHVSKVSKIAFLRLDGDLFESTWDAITALYDRLIPGGIVYVDDFGSFVGCQTAIQKFRTMHKIYEPLHYIMEQPPNMDFSQIVFEAVWWVKRYQ